MTEAEFKEKLISEGIADLEAKERWARLRGGIRGFEYARECHTDAEFKSKMDELFAIRQANFATHPKPYSKTEENEAVNAWHQMLYVLDCLHAFRGEKTQQFHVPAYLRYYQIMGMELVRPPKQKYYRQHGYGGEEENPQYEKQSYWYYRRRWARVRKEKVSESNE